MIRKFHTEIADNFAPDEHDISDAQLHILIGSSDSDTDQRPFYVRSQERPVNSWHPNACHQVFQPMQRR
jgi:hypothetical protein